MLQVKVERLVFSLICCYILISAASQEIEENVSELQVMCTVQNSTKLSLEFGEPTDCTNITRLELTERKKLLSDVDNNAPVQIDESDETKPCTGFTCPFQDICGFAPLNPLTQPRKGGKTPYVTNGEPEIYGEWPQYARLSIEYGNSLCGGVLISDKHVLTAAHCTFYRERGVKARDIKVYIADHSRRRSDTHETKARVKSICRSSRYNPSSGESTKYDYSVLTLDRAVQFNEHVQPACLPYKPVRIGIRENNNLRCYVVGFGVADYELKENAVILQKLRVRRTSCRNWSFRDDDRSRHCFENVKGKGDSCSGDSGGPILCLTRDKRWTVIGLVSYGTTECDGTERAGWVAVYTRIRALIKYMQEDCKI